MRDIALVILVFGSVVVAIRKPAYGMLLFVAFGIINPSSFAWGFGRSIPVAMIMAVATLAGYVVSPEPKRFPRQREVWMLLGLWFLFVVSTAFAYFPYNFYFSDTALSEFILVSKILVMVYLSMALLNTKERVQLLIKVVALSIGFFAIKGGVFGILSGGSQLVYGPEGSFLYANNSIGLALAMNVPLLYYLIQLESKPWMRWLQSKGIEVRHAYEVSARRIGEVIHGVKVLNSDHLRPADGTPLVVDGPSSKYSRRARIVGFTRGNSTNRKA